MLSGIKVKRRKQHTKNAIRCFDLTVLASQMLPLLYL